MEVETMKSDPGLARVHYERYRDSVKAARAARLEEAKRNITETGRALRKARSERTLLERNDEELAKAYKALSEGKTLIDLPQVLEDAGVCGQNLPLLAVAGADWQWVHLFTPDSWRHKKHRQRIWFADKNSTYDYRANQTKGFLSFNRDIFPTELWNDHWRRNNKFRALPVKAMVPTVPPHLRPDKLGEFFILWEAIWEAAPPVDPILLSKVNDTMYAVVAEWDLTELEQKVLKGRLS